MVFKAESWAKDILFVNSWIEMDRLLSYKAITYRPAGRGDMAVMAARLLAYIMLLALISPRAVADGPISFPRDRASSVAVIVRDLSTGRDVVSSNPHKAMLPASTMKCVTSAAAIEAGLDTARFETRVYIRGTIRDGVVAGDLVIVGSGDPTIESAQFRGATSFISEILSALKESGITRFEGGIVVDTSAFPDNGPCDRWELSDTRYEYGAGLYALNYRDNRVGDKAMDSPSEAFGEALENRLASAGITFDWDDIDSTDSESRQLLVHYSPRGREILDNLMERSDNLFAEGMLRLLAPGQPRSVAIAREKRLLADRGITLDITDIYDGSGLSRNNRVTAAFMADLLQQMAHREGKAGSYVSLFPIVGKEGTVKTLLKGTRLEGKLALKSGSMNGVHCYAGYKLDAGGHPTHAVVILINDFFCKRSDVRNAISGFLQRQF